MIRALLHCAGLNLETLFQCFCYFAHSLCSLARLQAGTKELGHKYQFELDQSPVVNPQ
jgi:hypothetical protein